MSSVYQRRKPVDHLVLDEGSIVLYEDHFVRLSPLGTCIVVEAAAPQTINSLAVALTTAFGSPTDGNAEQATRVAVDALVEQGILQEANHD